MHDYEKVNNEIKEFINMQENRPLILSDDVKPLTSDKNELVNLLTDLLDIYKDIQLMLETKDFENVKDKIIKSDVKNALVCESLMKILKDECSEKADIKNLYQSEKSKIKKLEEEKQELYSKINKMESDIEYTKRSSQELSRVIRDQKNLLIAAKDKAELERKACESVKNINKELEILRTKAYDRVQTFEKEVKIIKDKLVEKDKTIKSLQSQIKEFDKEKDSLNKKILSLEKLNEIWKRKFEVKENALDICNAELAKLINKDKKNDELLEESKEKASYYERLYKATNKQNEYLNAQLARLINHDNVEKLDKEAILSNSDLSLVTTQSKEHLYKRRMKKYKKKYKTYKVNEEKKQSEINEIKKNIEKIKIENKKLQRDKEEALNGNNEISKTLMNKVESLLAQNREYQNKLVDNKFNLKKDFLNTTRKENLNIYENINDFNGKNLRNVNYENGLRNNINETKQVSNNDDIFNESFKTVKEDNDSYIDLKAQPGDVLVNNNNVFASNRNIENVSYRDVFGNAGETKVRDNNDSTMFLDNSNFRRPFKLANEYDERPAVTIPENKVYKNVPNLRLPNTFFSTLTNKNNADKEDVPFVDNLRGSPKSKYSVPVHQEDVKSVDSFKSVKTTSSLKDMLKKTENLQNKFDSLEKQLEEINESELPPTKKIQDQIKAYTDYYYSDYLDFSNENDIL